MIFRSKKNGIFVDVTKPPYNCDPTGKEDCTAALRQAIDDILIREVEGVQAAREMLLAHPSDNIRIGFENRKVNGVPTVIFPEDPPKARILYFPEGTYLVTNTITYTLENLHNLINDCPSSELNRFIRIQGEGAGKSIIRLSDNNPLFIWGEEKAVVDFCRSNGSNVSMMNSIEDITIDIGSGNPGAVGLRFTSVNTGHVRNVTIKTSDPQGRGHAGYLATFGQQNLVENLIVEGFDYGLLMTQRGGSANFDGLKIHGCRKTGVRIVDANVAIRNAEIATYGGALSTTGDVMMTLQHARLTRLGNKGGTAVSVYTGTGYLRHIHMENFGTGVTVGYETRHKDMGYLYELKTAKGNWSLFPCEATNVEIDVPAFPYYEWDGDLEKVCEVDDYGTVADGKTDCTEQIQAALNSGKPYVVFGEGRYLVSRELNVPATVKAINFCYCDFCITPDFAEDKEHGLFAITEESEDTLFMDDCFAFEKFYGYLRFIRHSCKRDLAVSDVHVQTGAFYFNTVGGAQVFFSNVASTMGVFGGIGYGATPCFTISHGQKVYARQLNPERSAINCLCEGGSTLWVFGFKTEGPDGMAFAVRDGSRAEIMCGIAIIATDNGIPCIENIESDVFALVSTGGCGPNHQFVVAVKETQNGRTRCFDAEDMPFAPPEYYKIPCYVGVHQEKYARFTTYDNDEGSQQ